MERGGQDFLSKLADRGEEAISRLAEAPGGSRFADAAKAMRDRMDEHAEAPARPRRAREAGRGAREARQRAAGQEAARREAAGAGEEARCEAKKPKASGTTASGSSRPSGSSKT